MSRPRSTARVLRDMAKQEKTDATEKTIRPSEDRASSDATSDSDSAESRTTTTSAGEESSPVEDKTSGRLTRDDPKEVVKSSTKATAIISKPKVKARTFAVCPRCHERRYTLDQVGTKVKCINCRSSVVLT